jgi:hypothetical protein
VVLSSSSVFIANRYNPVHTLCGGYGGTFQPEAVSISFKYEMRVSGGWGYFPVQTNILFLLPEKTPEGRQALWDSEI